MADDPWPVTQADREAAVSTAKRIIPHFTGELMLAGERDADPLVQDFARHREQAQRPSGPYTSQAEAWNDAIEKAAQIVERYNAGFADPECGHAPEDIRRLKRPAEPSAGRWSGWRSRKSRP